MTIVEKTKNRKVGIVGMARSGMAAARLASKHGAQVFMSDASPAAKLVEQTTELDKAGVPYEVGGHTEKLLACDYLVLSPGVPLTAETLKRAADKGLPMFSEIEFASWFCKGDIIAITGSNGKTTTTTLLGEILTAGGLDAVVCGNIGRPFSEVVERIGEDAFAVLEISTFQLETIAEFKPHIAVLLNLSPDHLDRHGSFEEYKRLKYRITENQSADDYFVLNREDRETVKDNPETAAQRTFFSVGKRNGVASFVESGKLWTVADGEAMEIIKTDRIAIPGPHNLQNAAAASVVARLLDVAPKDIARVLESFPGVEHRLEKAGTVAGVRFVNDSKATNVDSVCYAVKSIEPPLYLILGGKDKGASYGPIAEAGHDRIKGLILIGEAREKIFDELGKTFPSEFADTLEDAVRKAFELAIPGEAVLLSPGCASFDMFDSFEHRGRVFKEAVANLKSNSNRNSNEKVNG